MAFLKVEGDLACIVVFGGFDVKDRCRGALEEVEEGIGGSLDFFF